MSDGYNFGQAGTLPPELFQQQQELNRQQRMAQMLTQQGAQQPQGQMISGRYVAPSIFQNLAGLANTAAGVYLAKKGDEQALELAKGLREYKSMENEAISEAAKAKDWQKVLDLTAQSYTGAGKEYVPRALENLIPAAEKPTSEMQNYKFALTPEGGGFKGSFNDFKNQMTPYQAAELGIQRMRLQNELGGGKPTEGQQKAGVFRSQMVGASNELNDLYSKGFNPNSPISQITTNLAGGLFNAVTPAQSQQAKQAQNQWTEAYLRFKTGAGTNAHEVEANRKTFFPEIGDKPDQIAQKARARAQAEHDIAIAAGSTARFGAQANPVASVAPSAPAPASSGNTTPSLWGAATVVSK
jgi:hypothetical protein